MIDDKPLAELRAWVDAGFPRVGETRLVAFQQDVAAVVERHTNLRSSFERVVLAIMDQPDGLDLLKRLLTRADEYRGKARPPV